MPLNLQRNLRFSAITGSILKSVAGAYSQKQAKAPPGFDEISALQQRGGLISVLCAVWRYHE